MEQSLYIIAPRRRGPVKIGIARDPKHRLATFQTAHWGRLHLFSSIRTRNARALETAAHRHLKPLRLKGEWFDISVTEARIALRQSAGANRFGIVAWLRRAMLARRIRRGRHSS